MTFQDYVHRVGRTGRAGNKGTAVTILTGWRGEVYYFSSMTILNLYDTIIQYKRDIVDGFSLQLIFLFIIATMTIIHKIGYKAI